MQRAVPRKTTDANEVSVSNDINEQLPTSDSRSNAEPSYQQASRPMAEQNRRLASCIGTEQSTELASSFSAEHQDSREPSQEAHIESRISMDSIPEIDRPLRQEGDSPRSVNTGDRLEGVTYDGRSQSTRVLPAQIPLLKLSTHLSQTSIIVLAARSIQSVMNVQMHSNKCRSKRLVQRFCRSLQTSVLFFPHITIRNVSLSNTEKHF